MAQTTATSSLIPFRPASSVPRHDWGLEALHGRLVELSGVGNTATLTITAGLIYEAQENDEPVAWVTHRDSLFFPPDFDARGIDLAALPIIRVPAVFHSLKATDILLRSGAFGLIVVDIGANIDIRLAIQTRLAGLARHHHSAVVLITEKKKAAATAGSLVSVRVESHSHRIEFDRYTCTIEAIKDKRVGPGWSHSEEHCGPLGLS